MTEFENHLSQTPVREIPAHWRREILAAAETKPVVRSWPFRMPQFAFRNLLWPHPAAWAVLAACWLLVAVLCFSGPRGRSLYVVTPPDLEPVRVAPKSFVLHRQALELMLEEGRISEQESFDRNKL